MTARELLDEIQCLRQRRALYIARLSPEQAQQLARQDMQAHSQRTQQFERAYLLEEMTMRARVNPHYKAIIDQAAMERLAAALQQSRSTGLTSQSAVGLEESCA